MKFSVEIGRSRRPVLNDQAVRAHLEDLLTRDRDIRALVAKCARSAAKDYIQGQAEAALAATDLDPEPDRGPGEITTLEQAAALEAWANTLEADRRAQDVNRHLTERNTQ